MDYMSMPIGLRNSKNYAVILINGAGICEYANPTFCNWFEIPIDSALGITIPKNIFLPPFHNFFSENNNALETQSADVVEIETQQKDGKGNTKNFRWEISRYEENGNGALLYMGRDISQEVEKKAFDEGKSKELEMLGLIADKTVNAVVMSDPDGKTKWVNNRFCEIFGYTREEVLGKNPGELLRGEESCPHATEIIQEAMILQKPYDVELINYRKNGEQCWIRVQGKPLINEKGEIWGILDIASDITKYKAQQEKTSFQAHLLDSIQQAVIVTDATRKITYWNKFAEKIYGWSKEDVLHSKITDILAPTLSLPLVEETLAKLSAGETWEEEQEVRHKNGQTIPASVIINPIYDSKGKITGIISISFDISERKKLDEDRKKSYNLLIKQYKKIKQFSYINAHDLRAPLTNILSISGLLKKDTKIKREDFKTYVNGLEDSAQQLEGVVRKLNNVLQGYEVDINHEVFGVVKAEAKKQVVLIDDDPIQNFINKAIISNNYPKFELVEYINAEQALTDILEEKVKPDLVLLDLNMPVMDGWTFLEKLKEAKKPIDFEVQILTSSIDQNDFQRAKKTFFVTGIASKPLQKEIFDTMV